MNCSKEQEAGGLGEPGAWELLGGSRNVFSRVQSTCCGTWEPSNSLEMSKGRAPIVVLSASSPGGFQVLEWCLPGTVSVLARLSPAPGVTCASAMLMVNS